MISPEQKKNEFSKHNLANYILFDELVRRFFTTYTLGIIPKYLTNEHFAWFKKQNHINYALHGVSHDEDRFDEFQGRDKFSIMQSLRIVRNIENRLGRKITDYIPPHNVVNKETILALKEFSFKTIFGGPGTKKEDIEFIKQNEMEYIHSEEPLEYGRSDELLQRGAVKHLNEKSQNENVCLCLHWPWEHNIGLNNLETFLLELF